MDPKPLWGGGIWLFGTTFSCPFGSRALFALVESIISPFAFFSPVVDVGSNSIAAKFHSSCPALPAFTPKVPFPTDQISCWGKKYFVFKSIF